MESTAGHLSECRVWGCSRYGGRCDFHPLRICTCHGCDDKENIRRVGEPYKASMRLVVNFMQCCMK